MVLIGFMGTGKSVVGRRLAAVTGRRFVDTDRQIEQRAGKSVAAIFRDEGEARFRERESEVVASLAGQEGCVIATGGGMALRPDQIKELGGIRVALTASPEVILERTKRRRQTRPLLSGEDRAAKIRRLLAERAPYYRLADLAVDTSQMSVDETVRLIQMRIDALEAGRSADTR